MDIDDLFDEAKPATETQDNKTILICDGENSIREPLQKSLQKKGHSVLCASDIYIAKTMLAQHSIDLIVMDSFSKDKKGIKFINQLHQHKNYELMPFVILTRSTNKAEILEFVKVQVLDIIGKPFLSDDAADRINNHLSDTKGIQTMTDINLLKQKTILVVDDNAENMFALAASLEALDVKVIQANSGEKALEKLDSHNDISMVLMDIMMPGMDGFDTTQKIKENPNFSHIPVVAVTANDRASEDEKAKGTELGAYLTKPIDMRQLTETIKSFI